MNNKHIRKARQGSKGFSLIELMIVIVILGLLSSIVVLNVIERPDEARVTKAKMDIDSMETALKLFRLDNGFYPTTEQGLAALITKPSSKPEPRNYNSGGYLDADSVPVDPWGNEYVYRCPGDSGRAYEIMSYGADATEGGSDFDADVKSWESKD